MKVHKIFCALSTGWLSAISIGVALAPEAAFSQASFFQGKTVDSRPGARPRRDRRPQSESPVSLLAEIYTGQADHRERVYARRRQPQGGKSHLQERAS